MTMLNPGADRKGLTYRAVVVLTVDKQTVNTVYPHMCEIAEGVMYLEKADLKLDNGVALFIGAPTVALSRLTAAFYGDSVQGRRTQHRVQGEPSMSENDPLGEEHANDEADRRCMQRDLEQNSTYTTLTRTLALVVFAVLILVVVAGVVLLLSA